MDAKNFTRIEESNIAICPAIKEPYTYITPAAFARIPLARADFSPYSLVYAPD
jgi:hypothetical protein